MKKSIVPHLALWVVNIIYAWNYILAKMVTPEYIKPFGIIFMRVGAAYLLFWLFHRLTLREKVKEWKDYGRFAYCALFGVALNQLLFFKGISITSSINTSIIMITSPIMVLVASSIILKERVGFQKILGVFFGLLGAFMLIGGKGFSFEGEKVWGDIMILINASSYGVYLVLVKPLMREYHPLTVIKWVFFFGFFMVLPFSWAEFRSIDWESLPDFAYWILAFIIIGVTFINYLFNTWSLGKVNASVVGTYIYLQPILTGIITALLGKESYTIEKALYSLIIFAGVYLVIRGK